MSLEKKGNLICKKKGRMAEVRITSFLLFLIDIGTKKIVES